MPGDEFEAIVGGMFDIPMDAVPKETLCPTTGEVCPDRVMIMQLFTGVDPAVAAELSIGTELDPAKDSAKRTHELALHAYRAVQSNCTGPADGECLVPQESRLQHHRLVERIGLFLSKAPLVSALTHKQSPSQ